MGILELACELRKGKVKNALVDCLRIIRCLQRNVSEKFSVTLVILK